jgi:hypothetical protein
MPERLPCSGPQSPKGNACLLFKRGFRSSCPCKHEREGSAAHSTRLRGRGLIACRVKYGTAWRQP